ncbi:hypothetical protein K2173_012732 [Erythroxylum novogranatense]|uniref:Peptidase C14 caspase domain-containing protein n=1 Tax=Erythroxylum novogranatense TaxID=1862640 RepID=A0AAV8SRY3_9ROSI|nr:hypothetical protein K2173_012732 [Erythroxylum novogranatense]
MEARIIKCSRCRQHSWLPATAKIQHCISCKQELLVNEGQPNDLVCLVRNGNVKNTKTYNHAGSKTIAAWDPFLHMSIKSASFERKPRKRALVCGVSYKKSRCRYRLKGAIIDAKNIKDLLISHLKFPDDCIRLLTDEEKDPTLCPTRENIEKGLRWLVEGSRSRDSLVFYFAGHGLQESESEGDELDGRNEAICPVDFEAKGKIVDNDINSTIVRPLATGVTLHAVIDTCHSATMLDLPYIFDTKDKNWINNQPPSGAYKGTSGGLAICIGACRDDQETVDSSTLSGKTSLTRNFIQQIKNNPTLTYGDLITSVQQNIDEGINEPTGLIACILRTFYRSKLLQDIQLSSSEKFDVYNKEFKL